jgi:S-DNA-T family DNA segregation ATPase FtsK/SpoIIIE
MAKKAAERNKDLEGRGSRVGAYWTGLESQRRLEISAIAVFTLALISFLALFSHGRDDLSLSPPIVRNWIGMPGAYTAWCLHFVLGYCAWVVPSLLLGWGILIVRGAEHPKHYFSRAIGASALLASLCGLLSLLLGNTDKGAFAAGGIVGVALSDGTMVFGRLGAYIVLGAVSLIALLLTTEFLFSRLFNRIQRRHLAWLEKRRRYEAEVVIDEDLPQEMLRPGEYSTEGAKDGRIRMGAILDPGEVRLSMADTDTDIIMDPALCEPEDEEIETEPNEEEEEIEAVLTEESADEPSTMTGIRISTLQVPPAEMEDSPDPDVSSDPISEEEYRLPPLSLLRMPTEEPVEVDEEEMYQNSRILEETLAEFGIKARMTEIKQGPVVTRYEFVPPPGVKVSRITSLSDNLALRLKATRLRMLAPIPGKAAIGVEIPNSRRREVLIREILGSKAFRTKTSKLSIALGMTLSGEPYVADLDKMPHLLIAGATGSGKSVCMNSIIASILYRATPDEVKLLLIDPKRVEMKVYNDIPHLLAPVVVDSRRAAGALKWIIDEMEQRYIYLSKAGVRDIHAYNKKRMADLNTGDKSTKPVNTNLPGYLPFIVVFIDELADMMMVARNDVEAMVVRLAQLARAVGIHLVIATQRPSVNVITGIIKANLPARIAFQVSSKVDSRTILDGMGADALLGQGDMLFSTGGGHKPIRLQGSLIDTDETERLCDYVKEQRKVHYLRDEFEDGSVSKTLEGGLFDDAGGNDSDDEELYQQAVQIVVQTGVASTSLLQRRLKIGYGRAARLIDIMHEAGLVGPARGSKPRKVLVNSCDEEETDD